MLKLTYTDLGICLEQGTEPLEALISRRVLVAVRLGQSIYLQTGRASFLLSATTPHLADLDQLIREEYGWAQDTKADAMIYLCPVDDQFVEVSVLGVWVAADAEAHEGTFITRLSDRVETLVMALWQTQNHLSVVSG